VILDQAIYCISKSQRRYNIFIATTVKANTNATLYIERHRRQPVLTVRNISQGITFFVAKPL
jgi:hypothetical protein